MGRVFKRKQTLTGKNNYRKWADWKVGEYVIGEYLEENEDNYGNPQYVLKVLDSNITDMPKDQRLALNSAGTLNKAMEKVTFGQVVEVVYQGTSEIEKGKYAGTEAHVVEISIMEEDLDSDMGV